jgi:hypothetical protein
MEVRYITHYTGLRSKPEVVPIEKDVRKTEYSSTPQHQLANDGRHKTTSMSGTGLTGT